MPTDVSTGALPLPENNRVFPALDGIRAVAVLMVFTQHYFLYPAAFRWGWIGVRIFFVLSGFLITGILYDTRNAIGRFKVFYARRALRIFPLFYGVLLLGWLLWPIFRWVWHPVWFLWPVYLGNYGRFIWVHDTHINPVLLDHLLSSRSYKQPFLLYYGHFWSLCVEEQFYLVWPFVVFTVRARRKLMTLCAVVVCISPVLRLLCLKFLSSAMLSAGFLERFTPLQCDSLLLGGLLALWLRGPHPDLTRLARWGLALSLLGFLLLQAASLTHDHSFYLASAHGRIFATVGFSGVNIFSASILLFAIDTKTWVFRVLQNNRLRWLGKISYGFYVFHDIPHVAYERLTQTLVGPAGDPFGLLTGAFALAGTLLLSWLSFRYFESRFLQLKQHFTVPRDA